MKLHVLRQIAPYPNNSLAQSPSKLIRSHAGDWIGGRHLSYSRIGLPNADHPIIQSAQNQQQHYPVVLIWAMFPGNVPLSPSLWGTIPRGKGAAMSDSDLLSVQLFFGSLAAGALGIAMTQAGWTHRWFVRGMFVLSAGLAACAIFWPEIAPAAPSIESALAFVVSSRIAWFLVGALVVATFLPQKHKLPWPRTIVRMFLERDSETDRVGIHTFPGLTYIQVSVTASKQVTQCKAWYWRSHYSPDGITPFALEHNERHPHPWSKAGLVTELNPKDPPARINIATFNASGNLQFDSAVQTPSNLYPNLQRDGLHRLEIGVVGFCDGKEISEKRHLFINWRGSDKRNAIVELKRS